MKMLAKWFMPVLACAAIAGAASASDTSWTIDINLSATTPTIGNQLIIGVLSNSLDGKDGNDAFQPSSPAPKVTILSTHPDAPALLREYRQDMRAPWTSGTKIWNNIVIRGEQLTVDDVVAVSWTPGVDANALPAGSYRLICTDTGEEWDLSKPSSFNITVPEGKEYGVLGNYRIVVQMGSDPGPFKIVRLGSIGRKVVTTPTCDENGNFYAAVDDGKLYRVASDGTATAIATPGSSGEGNSLRGGIARYGDKLYFVTSQRVDNGKFPAPDDTKQKPYTYKSKLCAYTITGSQVFTPVALPGSYTGRGKDEDGTGILADSGIYTPSSLSTPAVNTATGDIYVGDVSGISRIGADGTLIRTNPLEVAGLPLGPEGIYAGAFSPAIPGSLSDAVWVTAGNGKIYCLSSDLNTIKNAIQIGQPMTGSPSVQMLNGTLAVIVAGGNSLHAYNAMSGEEINAPGYAAGDYIGCTPFFTPTDNRAYFTSADGKVHAVDLRTMKSITSKFPLALPPTWLDETRFWSDTTLPKPPVSYVNATPIAFGGKLFVAAGEAGTGHYIIDIDSGNLVMNAGSDAAASTPVVSIDRSKVIFGTREGTLYIYPTGL